MKYWYILTENEWASLSVEDWFYLKESITTTCNAGLIHINNYLDLSEDIAQARREQKQVVNYLWDALYKIVLFEEPVKEIDMLLPFWKDYSTNDNILETPNTLLLAVRSLQSHVLKRGCYRSIDDYLKDNNAYISETFAALSGQAGYPVVRVI